MGKNWSVVENVNENSIANSFEIGGQNSKIRKMCLGKLHLGKTLSEKTYSACFHCKNDFCQLLLVCLRDRPWLDLTWPEHTFALK